MVPSVHSLRFGSRIWKVIIDQNSNPFFHFFQRNPVIHDLISQENVFSFGIYSNKNMKLGSEKFYVSWLPITVFATYLRIMSGNIWISYLCTAVKKWDISDPRSCEHNWTSSWKKNSGPYEIWTHYLCDIGAALYELSLQAYWELVFMLDIYENHICCTYMTFIYFQLLFTAWKVYLDPTSWPAQLVERCNGIAEVRGHALSKIGWFKRSIHHDLNPSFSNIDYNLYRGRLYEEKSGRDQYDMTNTILIVIFIATMSNYNTLSINWMDFWGRNRQKSVLYDRQHCFYDQASVINL